MSPTRIFLGVGGGSKFSSEEQPEHVLTNLHLSQSRLFLLLKEYLIFVINILYILFLFSFYFFNSGGKGQICSYPPPLLTSICVGFRMLGHYIYITCKCVLTRRKWPCKSLEPWWELADHVLFVNKLQGEMRHQEQRSGWPRRPVTEMRNGYDNLQYIPSSLK